MDVSLLVGAREPMEDEMVRRVDKKPQRQPQANPRYANR
jgi:hypothetical protein